MKFEVKTNNDDLLKSSFYMFLAFGFFSFTFILSNISIKLGTISKQYEINYDIRLNKQTKFAEPTAQRRVGSWA